LAAEIRDGEVAVSALAGKADVFYDLGYAAGSDSALAAAGAYDDKSLSHILRCRLGLLGARRMCTGGRGPEAQEACEETCASIGFNDVRCRADGMLICADAYLGMGRIDEAQSRLETVREEARRFGLRDVEARSCLELGRILLRQDETREAANLSEEALDIAAQLGLGQVEYLLGCADAWLAAGDQGRAAGHFERGLDAAATAVTERCPRRLGKHYVSRMKLEERLDRLSLLPGAADRQAALSAYRKTFGLK
jgi:tetratricopeptide (TPR) repeat protein